MTQETAPFVALRALIEAHTPRSVLLGMAEVAMSGRGFTVLRDDKGRVVNAWTDRQTCETAISYQAWALTEKARGRSLAEACKIHGFEILEVPPAAPPLDQVWHIHAEHPTEEPVIFEVYTDHARAVARCVELVNLIRDDRDAAIVDQATSDDWRAVLEELQDECPGLTFYVNLDPIPLRA